MLVENIDYRFISPIQKYQNLFIYLDNRVGQSVGHV